MKNYNSSNGTNPQTANNHEVLPQHTCTLSAAAWRLLIMISNDFEGHGNSFHSNTASIFRWRGRSWTAVWMPVERTGDPQGKCERRAICKNVAWAPAFFCPPHCFSSNSSVAWRVESWHDIDGRKRWQEDMFCARVRGHVRVVVKQGERPWGVGKCQ